MEKIEQKSVNEIRYLSATMVSNAGSGHTGVAVGAAPIFYSLYGNALKVSPCDPSYFNRDRFVLCAGHSSALYYAVLHAFNFPVTKQDVKSFRKMGSNAKGHPSFNLELGVDASSGPLGQGIPMAVGMAIAEKKLAKEFNKPNFNIIDHYTYVFAGDGSMMEGVTNEASSLAGTLELNKLIVIYDSNNITIEGKTDITFTENVLMRYKALGWNTIEVNDGEDIDAITSAIMYAKTSSKKPTIIKVNTEIGFGTPYANSEKIHGKALTKEELYITKQNIKVDAQEFTLSEDVKANISKKIARNNAQIEKEKALLEKYSKMYPDSFKELNKWLTDAYSKEVDWNDFEKSQKDEATRESSKYVLNKLAEKIPNLISGSADLAPSTGTELMLKGDFSATNVAGRNLHFGIREHAMAAICNGIMLHGGFRVVCSTFMVFSDYMRHAIRMSALMGLPVIYLLSHDSIGVGEDGKTHQPVEYNAIYRAMPNVHFNRPADRLETVLAYKVAFSSLMPSILAVSRQKTPSLVGFTSPMALKGGYFALNNKNADVVIYSAGTEVALSILVAQELFKLGVVASVVSVPSSSILENQSSQYKNKLVNIDAKLKVAIEASNDFYWYKLIGTNGLYFGVSDYGFTASGVELYNHFGLNAKTISKQILKHLKK